MTDDEQDFFNKSIGKLEKEIIALKNEYQAECNRADELEDSLHISWQNESKLKELLRECKSSILFEADVVKETSGKHSKDYKMLSDLLTRIDAIVGAGGEK